MTQNIVKNPAGNALPLWLEKESYGGSSMRGDRGIIFDIKKYAIHDGPGIRTSVFFKGCPLSCLWCHNPEGISGRPHLIYRRDRCIGCSECINACPNEAISLTLEGIETDSSLCKLCGICAEVCPAEAREFIGQTIETAHLVQIIEKDVPFFDESCGGVTFSGGEPLLQAAFLLHLLDACGRRGIHRTVDTSGYADTTTIMAVAEKTDLFLFDLKVMDREKHERFTGVSNEKILSNLTLLAKKGANISIRIPLIPGINDDERNIEQTAAFVEKLPNIHAIHILPYHDAARNKYEKLDMDYHLGALEAPHESLIETILERFTRAGLEARIGG